MAKVRKLICMIVTILLCGLVIQVWLFTWPMADKNIAFGIRSLSPTSGNTDRDSKMGDKKPNFTGTWKLAKSENFEEFLAANGANWFIRKMASKASVTAEITHDGGDNFEIKTTTPMRTQIDNFVVGTPYESETMGGAKMKVTPSWDGNGILLTSECIEEGKGKPYTNKREIVDGQLILTMTVDGVVCKRWFDKV